MASGLFLRVPIFMRPRKMSQRGFSDLAKATRPARPQWLEAIHSDNSPGPRLFSWTLANLSSEHSRQLYQARKPHAPEDERRRIYVLGIGNLGRLFATSLARLADPRPVTLVVHRKTLLELWAANPGVELTRSGTTDRVINFDIEWWTEEKPDRGPVAEVCDGQAVSNLIVATKAPDALPQVDRIRNYLGGTSTVVFVQNGMNKLWPPYGDEYHKKRYPSGNHPNWVVCVTTHGVTSLGNFKSLHASPADVSMGTVCLNPENAESAEYLTSQIMTAPYLEARKVSRSTLWVLQLEKLLVNATINPLSAVLRCKNGVLFSNPDGPAIRTMDRLIKEASGVFQALVRDESSREMLLDRDHDPVSDVEQAVKVRQEALLDRFSVPRLRAMLHSVGERVKDNRSSMLQDVTSGKTTEIREFNGWLVDTAGYLGGGLDVTSHRMMIDLVEEGVILEESGLGKYFPLPFT